MKIQKSPFHERAIWMPLLVYIVTRNANWKVLFQVNSLRKRKKRRDRFQEVCWKYIGRQLELYWRLVYCCFFFWRKVNFTRQFFTVSMIYFENLIDVVSFHLFLSIPPENILKPLVFRCFQGYRKRPVVSNRLVASVTL